MSLIERRRAIYHLLDNRSPADAMAAYYAYYHDDSRTTLRPYPLDAARSQGYVCLSRTGIDLFRPLVTLRLPIADMETSAKVIYDTLDPGMAVILNAPASYLPLLQGLFEIHREDHLQLYVLDQEQFEPIINVLVTQDIAANNLPRFMVKDRDRGEIAASATLNWQSPNFAEIGVNTRAGYRRRGWGRSVVAGMVNYLLNSGRQPLYLVTANNEASQQLATRIGFKDSGLREVMVQGVLRPQP